MFYHRLCIAFGIPSVRQLLSQLTSYELTEWMAYEKYAGPLGNGWRDNVQAEQHYLTQWTNYLLGAQVTPTKGKDKDKNPVPLPQFPARPWVDAPEHEDEEPDAEDEE